MEAQASRGGWTAAGGGFRIIQQGFLPVVALSVATSAIVGQNLGAGKSSRVRRAAFGALAVACGYGTLLSIVLFVFGETAGLLFIKNPEWLPVAVTYFDWSAWLGIAVGMSLVPSFVLQAAGKAVRPAGAAVFRVVLLAVLILGIPEEQPAWVFGVTTATALGGRDRHGTAGGLFDSAPTRPGSPLPYATGAARRLRSGCHRPLRRNLCAGRTMCSGSDRR